mmetsp:Transcript_28744/g.78907  ORF Transcript_28744/g.78907 Transcript_28744/m.78907 type:complete len:245 (-) Transcript_28744:463-1197(-)
MPARLPQYAARKLSASNGWSIDVKRLRAPCGGLKGTAQACFVASSLSNFSISWVISFFTTACFCNAAIWHSWTNFFSRLVAWSNSSKWCRDIFQQVVTWLVPSPATSTATTRNCPSSSAYLRSSLARTRSFRKRLPSMTGSWPQISSCCSTKSSVFGKTYSFIFVCGEIFSKSHSAVKYKLPADSSSPITGSKSCLRLGRMSSTLPVQPRSGKWLTATVAEPQKLSVLRALRSITVNSMLSSPS